MWRTARFIFLLLILVLPLRGSAQHISNRLLIENSTFDFGIVPQYSTVTQFFWFRAVGQDTVKITKIQTGCDCTTIPMAQNWIAPGDSMLVGVYWNTERKVGNSARYPYIWIAGQEEAERLALTASVALRPDSSRPVSVQPYKAELSKAGALDIDTVRVQLTNHSDSSIALSLVSIAPEQCQVTVPESLAAHATGNVVVALRPEFAHGEFERSVTVEFRGTRDLTGRFTIPIRRKIIA